MPFGPWPGSGGAKTLHALYAFGLGDNPVLDNFFEMPAGNMRFPGLITWGAGAARTSAADEYYQNKAAIDLSAPPGGHFTSLAFNNSGGGGSGCGRFNIFELNDPAWNGNLQSLGGAIAWLAEFVNASNDPSQNPAARVSTTYASRSYDANAQAPWTYPNAGKPNLFAMEHIFNLYNPSTDTDLRALHITGYGEQELLAYAVRNGANAQWLTHWNNNAAVPAIGDGPAWFVDSDGRFAHFNPAAGLQAYQRATDAALAWGWRMFARGSTPGSMDTVLDVTSDGGTLVGHVIPETFISDSIDFTNTGGIYNWIPSRPGYVIGRTPIIGIILSAASGTYTTGPTVSSGNNVTLDNVIISTANVPTLAGFNFAAALNQFPYLASTYGQNANSATSSLLNLSTPIQFKVITGAAGAGLVLKGRIVTVASLIPIASLS